MNDNEKAYVSQRVPGVHYIWAPKNPFCSLNLHSFYYAKEYCNGVCRGRRILVECRNTTREEMLNWENQVRRLGSSNKASAIMKPYDVWFEDNKAFWIVDSGFLPDAASCVTFERYMKQNTEYFWEAAETYVRCLMQVDEAKLPAKTVFYCKGSNPDRLLINTSPGGQSSIKYTSLQEIAPADKKEIVKQILRHPSAREVCSELARRCQRQTPPAHSSPAPASVQPELRARPIVPSIAHKGAQAQAAPDAPRKESGLEKVGKVIDNVVNFAKKAASVSASKGSPVSGMQSAPSGQPLPQKAVPSAAPNPFADYRFPGVPALGRSCLGVCTSTGNLVRFDHHDQAEKELLETVDEVKKQLMKNIIMPTPGLCQLQDKKVSAETKSFLIIRETIDPEGYLPVGHPELLKLEQEKKLIIAKKMVTIFVRIAKAGWLPLRIIESSMMVNPKTLEVCFADGHLLSRREGACFTCSLGYAAPECMVEKPQVTQAAVSYALAVWLYRLFVGGYPMEGSRTLKELQDSGLSETEMAEKLYGKNALFCFDLTDTANTLNDLGGHYSEQARRWANLPKALMILWLAVFSVNLHENVEERPGPDKWLEAIEKLLQEGSAHD